MILLKAVHVPLILADVKTQTRRLWPHGCRAKVGSVHWAQTSFKPDSRFARLHILRVWREELGNISEADACAEGYDSGSAYLNAFFEINKVDSKRGRARVVHERVWAVEFERSAR